MRLWRVILLVLCLSCGPTAWQIQARASNAMALAVEHSMPALLTQYEHEANHAIDSATTADEARAALAAHDAKWDRVWSAVHSFVRLHEHLVAILEAGEEWPAVMIAELLDAYCALPIADLPKEPCR